MRQYVISETDMQSLFDQLQLTAMRGANVSAYEDRYHNLDKQSMHKAMTDDLHRAFHFVVVRWAQAQGFTGLHS